MQAVDKLVSAIRSINSVDKDIMSLLPQLDIRCLLNIGAGDPLYADLDAIVRSSKSEITKALKNALKRPVEFLETIQEFSWLLSQDVDEYLETFINSESSVTIEVYEYELSKLDSAVKSITNLCFSLEDFGLIRLNTETVKSILSSKALSMRDGLLNMIVVDSRKKNFEVVQEYKSMLERIAEKPANEKQLRDLREYIKSTVATVEGIKERVKNTRRALSILDIYCVPLPVDDMMLSWSTLEYPSTIEHSGKGNEYVIIYHII
jgi:dynein heavy chain